MKTAGQLLQNVSSWFRAEGTRRKRSLPGNAQRSSMESLEQRMLLTVPVLSSNPGAAVSIYLDFDGENMFGQDLYYTQRAFFRNAILPAFTVDNNVGPDSPLEERMIEEIFQRVAEDFKPFTVNVTTEIPSPNTSQIHVIIGGNGNVNYTTLGISRSHLFTTPAFGLQGAFTNRPANPVLVFPQQLQSIDGLNVARLISRGVGYQLGLENLQVQGTTDSGPIMGNPSLNPVRDIWSSGNTANGFQDDIAVMVGNGAYINPGFRLQPDDIPDTIAQAAPVQQPLVVSPVVNGTVELANSQIHSNPATGQVDSDFYSLALDFRSTTGTAQLSLFLNGLDLSTYIFPPGIEDPTLNPGSNLDLIARLYDSSGNLVFTSDPLTSINAQIEYEIPAGAIPANRIATYFLQVTTTTELGSLGAYTVTGALQEVLGAPVVLAPSGNISTISPTYEWTASLQATSYRIQVQNVSTGVVVIDETSVQTTHLSMQAISEGNFQVRVKAIRGTGGLNNESEWSEYLQFSVDVPTPARPRVLRPIGDIAESFPTFEWTSDVNSSNYDIWVNNANTQQRIIYRTALAGTTYVHFDPLPDGVYRAWVRAYNTVGEYSAWSDFVAFTIDAAIPVAPKISAPTSITASTNPRIVWNAVDSAARYDLWVNHLTTGTAQYIRRTDISRLTPYFDPPAMAQGSYVAWVRAANGNNELSPWSAGYSFTIDVLPPGIPQMNGPTGPNGSLTVTTANPTFKWTAVDRAVKYDLWVNNVTTGQAQIIREQNVTGTQHVALRNLPQGNYRAWVRGINSANEVGEWSPVYAFTLDEAIPSIPVITAPVANPAGSVENPNPTFVWTSQVDAPFYEFRLDDVTLNQTGVIRVTNLTAKSYTIPNNQRLAEHVYQAFVRGINSSGEMSDWSAAYLVRIDVPNPATPSIIGPVGSSKDTTPTFQWSHDPAAYRYEVLVRDLERNESIVLQVQTIAVDPTGKISFYTLPDNQALRVGTYRFWIRAFNSLGTSSSWSNSQTFVISASLDLNDLKLVDPAKLQSAEAVYTALEITVEPEAETSDAVTGETSQSTMSVTESAQLPVSEATMPLAAIEELMESLADPSSVASTMLSGSLLSDATAESRTTRTSAAAASILALAMFPVRRKRREA